MTKSSNERYHDYTGRTRTRAWLRSQGRPCWICGGQIDYAAPRTHPLAFEVDELVPVSRGGSATDRANVDAAHRICNNWRSNKMPAEVIATRAIVAESFGGWTSAPDFVAKAKACKGIPRKKAPKEAKPTTTTAWL